jgi:kynureninase
MDNVFRSCSGANGYRLSNPNVMATVCLLGSLRVFEKTSMEAMRQKSLLLTGYLETLIKTLPHFHIITPSNPQERGCQLSLLFEDGWMMKVFEYLSARGVICDERKPNVIRIAPTPLYTRFENVFKFYQLLKEALEQ